MLSTIYIVGKGFAYQTSSSAVYRPVYWITRGQAEGECLSFFHFLDSGWVAC